MKTNSKVKDKGEWRKNRVYRKDSKYKDYKTSLIDEQLFFRAKQEPLTYIEWQQLLSGQKDIATVSKDRIRQSFVDGLPESIRGDIWCLLCDFEQERLNHSESIYKSLLAMEN